MFSATPTTVVQGMVSAFMRMHWPIGSRPGQSTCPIAWLTTITRGAPSTSVGSMPRPRSSRVPMVAKYSGVTVRDDTLIDSPRSAIGLSKNTGFVCPPTSGIRFTTAALATPGTARTASTSRM